MTLPGSLQLDAWTGAEAASGDLDRGAAGWGARAGLPHSQQELAFGAPADPTAWWDPEVGYGVLLPEAEAGSWTPAQLAAGADAPEPVRELIAARPGTVVLRWTPALGDRFVRRAYADGTSQDPAIGLTPFGTARNRLPRYVLIAAGPEAIPWSVQYALAVRHAVGRLPLSGDALGHYVGALLDGWAGAAVDLAAPLVWAVDHGGGDITSLMRAAIAAPLAEALSGTLERLLVLAGAEATGPALVDAAAGRSPALVVTSSHGATMPLAPPGAMAATLGLPVDAGLAPVPVADLARSVPHGAVWYAQACCSAGAAGTSQFADLLAAGSTARATVEAVAALGSVVAPAALALLGRPRPVRAVLGHVEPTFDWTLRVPETGQKLGAHIVTALSSNLFHGQPLGYAFREYREGVGVLHTAWARRREQLDHGDTSVREELTWLRLSAFDRQSLVLLGDPTAALPPLDA
ncbi:hypothetical protein [Miltoncostaea marina]|uniref:hypothetical protein n=1 Tax=Miltoncostaea marina TaxID=2843215 RepID=UPI001C3C859A|nr:hypothetical protein [Miltoncostaea marina]